MVAKQLPKKNGATQSCAVARVARWICPLFESSSSQCLALPDLACRPINREGLAKPCNSIWCSTPYQVSGSCHPLRCPLRLSAGLEPDYMQGGNVIIGFWTTARSRTNSWHLVAAGLFCAYFDRVIEANS